MAQRSGFPIRGARPLWGKGRADGQKPLAAQEDGEHRIEHEHKEDGFHHSGGDLRSKQFGAPFHAHAFEAPHQADDKSRERRLDEPDIQIFDR